MMKSPRNGAEGILGVKKNKRRLILIVAALALVVTAATAAVLHLRGEAMNHTKRVLECAFEVHEHTDECYSDGVLVCGRADCAVHKHNDDCYENGALVCPLEELEEHVHDESCLGEVRELVCGLEESPAHTHDESCLGEVRELVCSLEESAGHTHGAGCISETRQLTCGLEEGAGHTHDAACYREIRELTCGLEEGADHTHNDSCYTVRSELVCGLAENAGHAHTDECYTTVVTYTCGLEESAGHTHTDDCFQTVEGYVCGLEEGEGHTHTDDCYEMREELVCGKPEVELHTHTDECYERADENDPDSELVLACGKLEVLEHTHNELCFRMEELSPEEVAGLGVTSAAEERELVYADESVRVTACFDRTAELPDDAALTLVDAGEDGLVRPAFIKGEPDTEGQTPEAGQTSEIEEPETQGQAPKQTPEESPASGPDEAGELTPASAVTYTVQYLDAVTGEDLGGAKTYTFIPGEAQPTFPRALGGSVRTLTTDEFEVRVSYTDLAEIPDEAELYARLVTDEETVAHYESDYRSALHTDSAEMSHLLDIGFTLDGEELEPAAPVSITIQFLDENGLPVGERITVVHFAEQGAEVIRTEVDEQGAASFEMNGFSKVAIGSAPERDEEGRVSVDTSFVWQDKGGLYRVVFSVKGVLKPYVEHEPAPEGEQAGQEEIGEETVPETPDAPLADPDLLAFTVETLGEDSELYEAFAEYSEGNGAQSLNLAVLRYVIDYDGVRMDFSDCVIEATVSPTAAANAAAKSYSDSMEVDNGDDDGDGYVLAPDGESLLPAPEVGRGLVVSALVPADGGVTDISSIVVGESAEEQADVSLDDLVQSSGGGGEVTPALPGTAFDAADGLPQMAFTLSDAGAGGDEGIMALDLSEQANPGFTVEYYAVIPRVVLVEAKDRDPNKNYLEVIDTSKIAGNNDNHLPQNGADDKLPPVGYMELNSAGVPVWKNDEQTEIYAKGHFKYYESPSLSYFNALLLNDSYTLSEIWVQDGDKVGTESWDVQYVGASVTKVHFTNFNATVPPSEAGDEYIWVKIQEGSNIRLVFEPKTASKTIEADFFDYDIGNGQNAVSGGNTTVYTAAGGINAASGYPAGATGAHFVFGNVNTGVTRGTERWNGYLINGRNREGGWGTPDMSYMGSTFGMVSGITGWSGDNPDPDVVFSTGIVGPTNLFSGTARTGKRVFDGTLGFGVIGDTFTLGSATVSSGGTSYGTISGLDRFFHPSPGPNLTHSLWTNNFWPMDGVPLDAKKNDPKLGKAGEWNGSNAYLSDGTAKFDGSSKGNFPVSDDGKAHNSYFGMRYQVEFTLDKNYVGPLEYLFFGDDDMWVFLDDELVCDLGGVRQSCGEYVDLWQHLQKEGRPGDETHRLTFFYTERGASGSTCWMQFTLPSAVSTSTTTSSSYGELEIHKTVMKSVNGEEPAEFDNGEEFRFTLSFRDAQNHYLPDAYSYTRYAADGTPLETNLVLYTGAEFSLKHGEYVVIRNILKGTQYFVTECGEDRVVNSSGEAGSRYDYTVTANGVLGSETSGAISDNQHRVDFVNAYTVFELPETGGPGTGLYALAGGFVVVTAASLLVYTKRRRARG